MIKMFESMPNQRTATVKITRGELCALILLLDVEIDAIVCERKCKWKDLRDKLSDQLRLHDMKFSGSLYGKSTEEVDEDAEK